MLLAGQQGFGQVDHRPTYEAPGRTATFPFHLGQAGVFLDLGGADRYLRRPVAGGEDVPDAEAGDDRTWRREARGVGPAGFNVAIGRDVGAGRLGFLDPWPARLPPPPPPEHGDEDDAGD